MASAVNKGDFVHVVATFDMKTKEGKIRYVNPANTTIESDAPTEPDIELLVSGAGGEPLQRTNVVLRRSSCDPGQSNDVGLIQADLVKQPGMKSVSLLYKGQEVSRFDAGEAIVAPAGRSLGLAMPGAAGTTHRSLTIDGLGDVAPVAGVTYSVQVKPDTGGPWNTIAVGRDTPNVAIDRNQFAGARQADVRVLRTTGFDEDVFAEGKVDLFNP